MQEIGDVLGEAVETERAERAVERRRIERIGRRAVGPRAAPDAEIDASRGERVEDGKLLGGLERRQCGRIFAALPIRIWRVATASAAASTSGADPASPS
jgi:hypothetical protein